MINKDKVKIGDNVVMLQGNRYNSRNSIATITKHGMAKGEVALSSVLRVPIYYDPTKTDKINVNDKVSVEMKNET